MSQEELSKNLYLAVRKGDLQTVNGLLSSGANPNTFAGHGNSREPVIPLHIAAIENKVDMMKSLLNHGANVNIEGDNGWTALQLAAKHGNLESLNLLLERGAKTNVKNSYGDTALHKASNCDKTQCIKVLLAWGNSSEIDAKGKDGRTSLHVACYKGKTASVRILLESGASVNVMDCMGRTPRSLAMENGKDEVVKALDEFAAGQRTNNSRGASSTKEKEKAAVSRGAAGDHKTIPSKSRAKSSGKEGNAAGKKSCSNPCLPPFTKSAAGSSRDEMECEEHAMSLPQEYRMKNVVKERSPAECQLGKSAERAQRMQANDHVVTKAIQKTKSEQLYPANKSQTTLESLQKTSPNFHRARDSTSTELAEYKRDLNGQIRKEKDLIAERSTKILPAGSKQGTSVERNQLNSVNMYQEVAKVKVIEKPKQEQVFRVDQGPRKEEMLQKASPNFYPARNFDLTGQSRKGNDLMADRSAKMISPGLDFGVVKLSEVGQLSIAFKLSLKFEGSENGPTQASVATPSSERHEIKSSLDRRSEARERPTCCVCRDAEAESAMIPCGHLCICHPCAAKMKVRCGTNPPCPLCRNPTEQAVKIFNS